jgi:hypothetical protein
VRRLDMVDMLRGLVIALMVLDHTRDYFHISAYTFNPTDPARTYAWLYLTRFLLTRGAWLIVLELTVISFGFNFALPFLFQQVIWTIGMRMILLAGAIALFMVLRAINGCGDPAPWQAFPGVAATVMSFFNVSKYPPSPLYVLITLGISALEGIGRTRAARIWPNTAVYICATYICGARCVVAGRGTRRLPGVVPGELPGRSVPAHAGGFRFQPADGLRSVARDLDRAVSGSPLVRRREAAAARVVAELSLGLKAWFRSGCRQNT